jgi:CHAD domain
MKALKKYLKKREAEITALLRKDVRSYDARTVHAFRVEIKKMNAFVRLINYAAGDFNRKKILKPFKAIFRQAGKLRELQVEEAMLKKYTFNSLLTDYRKDLKHQRSEEQKDFYSILNSKLARRVKKNCRKIFPLVSEADEKKVSQYLKKKQKKIEKLVTKNTLQTAELHKLRKWLKELEYNRNSVGIKEPKSRSVKANTLPILLGKWHDCQVMIRHLEKVTRVRGKHPREVAQLKKTTKDVSADRDLLFDKIKMALTTSRHYRQ